MNTRDSWSWVSHIWENIFWGCFECVIQRVGMKVDLLSHGNHVLEPVLVVDVLTISADDVVVETFFKKTFLYDINFFVLGVYIDIFWLVWAVETIWHAFWLSNWKWAVHAFKVYKSWSEKHICSKWLIVLSNISDLISWQVEDGRVPKLILNSVIWVWKAQINLNIDLWVPAVFTRVR